MTSQNSDIYETEEEPTEETNEVEDDIPVTSANSDIYETEEVDPIIQLINSGEEYEACCKEWGSYVSCKNGLAIGNKSVCNQDCSNPSQVITIDKPDCQGRLLIETQETITALDPTIQSEALSIINSGQNYIVDCTVWGGDVTCRNGVVTNNATACNPDCSDPSKVDINKSRKLQSSANIINSGQEYKIECEWTKTNKMGIRTTKSEKVTCKNGAPVGSVPNNACIAQCSESSKVV